MVKRGRRRKELTFEDLKGLRAAGYIRDSNLDQRDGFGPEIQRRNIERFADSYGLELGDMWYTEFVSGRSSKNRYQFQQFLEDGRQDLFDVLLVFNTSRFGRNQADCIRHKEELQQLGKILVFVSQGIISGSDRDFMNERMNETLDEQYSRNLSYSVTEGFSVKADQGYAIGRPPLGYRTEKAPSGRGAYQVVDPKTQPALLAVLEGFSSGEHSFRTLAQELNSKGYRTSDGKPFTESSISTILNNRYYEGLVVYHRGQPDEEVIPGVHEVPEEVRELWSRCQDVRRDRKAPRRCRPPSREQRVYPLSGVLTCDGCGQSFHGIGTHKKGDSISMRMAHSWHRCEMRPQSVSSLIVEREFAERVIGCIKLDEGWHSAVLRAMSKEGPEPDNTQEIKRIDVALANLRKQHLWGVIGDAEFKAEHQALELQKRGLEPKSSMRSTPDLDRAAELLRDLPALWEHPGVTPEQRRDLTREVFDEVRLREGKLVAVKPRAEYVPLFAYSVWKETGGVGGKRSP